MDTTNIIGYIATVVSTATFLPQVVKTWKSKSTKDLSFEMTLLGAIGSLLWLVYGIFIKAYPMIFANTIAMSCFIILFSFKLKYK